VQWVFRKLSHAFVDRWFVFRMSSYPSRPWRMCEERQDSAFICWSDLYYICKWIMTWYWCYVWTTSNLPPPPTRFNSATGSFPGGVSELQARTKKMYFGEVVRRDLYLGWSPLGIPFFLSQVYHDYWLYCKPLVGGLVMFVVACWGIAKVCWVFVATWFCGFKVLRSSIRCTNKCHGWFSFYHEMLQM